MASDAHAVEGQCTNLRVALCTGMLLTIIRLAALRTLPALLSLPLVGPKMMLCPGHRDRAIESRD